MCAQSRDSILMKSICHGETQASYFPLNPVSTLFALWSWAGKGLRWLITKPQTNTFTGHQIHFDQCLWIKLRLKQWFSSKFLKQFKNASPFPSRSALEDVPSWTLLSSTGSQAPLCTPAFLPENSKPLSLSVSLESFSRTSWSGFLTKHFIQTNSTELSPL